MHIYIYAYIFSLSLLFFIFTFFSFFYLGDTQQYDRILQNTHHSMTIRG